MIDITIKKYNDLSLNELYGLLQLRVEVFCVEQECVYQDIDGKDPKALHVIGTKEGNIVAYARLLKSGDYFNIASISRVVVAKNERQHKYGYDIMNASIKAVQEQFNETAIKVSAQSYLRKFYNNLGFKEVGEEYLEDGIPHIAMIRT